MFTALQSLPIWLLLLIATVLEATGDAAVRLAIYNHAGPARAALLVTGAAPLLGYGCFVNTPPVEFGRVECPVALDRPQFRRGVGYRADPDLLRVEPYIRRPRRGTRRTRRDQQSAMLTVDSAELMVELVDIPFGREIGSAIAHCTRIARRTWRVAADLPNSRHAN